jgi:hypothetical protein
LPPSAQKKGSGSWIAIGARAIHPEMSWREFIWKPLNQLND